MKTLFILLCITAIILILIGKGALLVGILDFLLVLFGIFCFFGGIISLFVKEARKNYIASIAMIVVGGILVLQAIKCFF